VNCPSEKHKIQPKRKS